MLSMQPVKSREIAAKSEMEVSDGTPPTNIGVNTLSDTRPLASTVVLPAMSSTLIVAVHKTIRTKQEV